ncbi:hypothetical protein Tco_1514229, partial [Tanacetum coccineum]
MERAITTDASLVAAHDSDNIIRTQTTAMPNVDIPQGMDIGGSPRRQETIGVLDLEKEKDAQAVEILKLKQRVKKLERKRKSSISHPRRRIYRQVESSDDDLDKEDASYQIGTLIKIKEEKAKEKEVAIKDVEDSSRPIRLITTLQPLPTIDPKDKGKGILQETKLVEKTKKRDQGDAQIERDAKIALRLQAKIDEELRARIDANYELAARMTQEVQDKYTIEERVRLLAEFFERRKKQLAAERVEAIRNKPPTKTQLRNLMMTYLKNMDGYKHSQLKGKSYEEIQGFYERQQKRIQDFTSMDSEKEAQKPSKRLKRFAGSYAIQKSPKKLKVMKSAKDVTVEEAAEYEKEI